MELIPTPIPDRYCETRDEAFAEIQRRRALPQAKGMLTRYEKTAYGSYRVFSKSVLLLMVFGGLSKALKYPAGTFADGPFVKGIGGL